MAPCVNRRPLIRLTCSTRSAIKVLRSRPSRRRSSSSTLGGLAIAQTLGSPRLKAISDRSSVDDVAFDPLPLRRPVDPEPVQSRFLNDDDRIGLARTRHRFALKLRQTFEKLAQISCRRRVLRHLLARPWRNRRQKPSRTAQFQRNENRANIHSDSGRRIGPLNSLEHRPLQSEVVAASLWQSAGRYPPPWNLRCPQSGRLEGRLQRAVSASPSPLPSRSPL